MISTSIHSLTKDQLGRILFYTETNKTSRVCKFWHSTIVSSHWEEYRKELSPFLCKRYFNIRENSELYKQSCLLEIAKTINEVHNQLFVEQIPLDFSASTLKQLVYDIQSVAKLLLFNSFCARTVKKPTYTFLEWDSSPIELATLPDKLKKTAKGPCKKDFKKMLSISLADDTIKTVTAESLCLFANLTKLTLSISIPFIGIKNWKLCQLERLCLENISHKPANHEEQIDNILSKFNEHNINELTIANCTLQKIPQMVFKKFSQIQELSLVSSTFTDFPYDVFQLENISYLKINANSPLPGCDYVEKTYSLRLKITPIHTSNGFNAMLSEYWISYEPWEMSRPQKKQKMDSKTQF